MCDYSLHAVPNRLAVEGEELVTHRFATSSIGLASPLDLEAERRERADAAAANRSLWSAVKSWLNPPPPRAERIPAVCIPPGARLRMTNIPQHLQKELDIGPNEDAVFVELSASAYRYRDGVRFGNGREILLQYLDEGLPIDVLSLALAETPEERIRIHAI